jgi:hypothetical protein
MSNSTPPNLGTLGVSPYLSVSSAPQIIFEWAALIPLVIYLSTYRHSYKLVGKTALGCSLGVTLFPKLGILSSIADLLEQGSEYLDRACSVSELRKEIWDANFGGQFPCANGAVSEMITSTVIRDEKGVIEMPGILSPTLSMPSLLSKNVTGLKPLPSAQANTPQFQRRQTLHILHFAHRHSGPLLRQRLFRLFSHKIAQFLILLLLFGGSVISCLFGLYGTGAAVLISALFHLCRQCIRVNRPATYLLNNELDDNAGCMLAGIHQNASIWYLYIGDRGIIDSLLNKPMIEFVTTVFGALGNKYIAIFLRILAVLQLLSMTFVAAQRGWDGISMLVLIITAWLSDLLVYGDNYLAKSWISSESIGITAKSFRFTGRAIMLGAIQAFKRSSVESWMDDILAPSDRRTVWLHKLNGVEGIPNDSALEALLTAFDREWVERNFDLTQQAVKIMRREFPTW